MRRYSNECERCHCPLDPAEGRICEECRDEMERDAAYARLWHMNIEMARQLREQGLAG